MVFSEIKPYIRKQLFIAFCLNIGQIVCGAGFSWCSPSLARLQDPAQSPLGYGISDEEGSWITSCYYIPCLISLSIGHISNVIGRKKCLIIGALTNLLSFIMLTWPYDIITIYLGRTFLGFGMMCTFIVMLVYFGEIASPNIRGYLFTSMSIFQSAGILLTYTIGAYFSYVTLGCVISAISLVYLTACFVIPESPLYFVIKGKEEEAKRSLVKLGRNKNIDKELKAMTDHAKMQLQEENEFQEIFTIKSNRKAFMISVVLFVIQNCNGFIPILSFSMILLKKSGSSIDLSTATIVEGSICLLGASVAPFAIEKYGRKFLLILSCSFCALAMASLGAYFYLLHIEHPSTVNLSWIPLTSFVVSLFSHFVGLTIIPNTLTGEMFRPNVRSTGTSLCMTVGLISGFIVTTSFGYVVSSLGTHLCFLLFSIDNVIGLLFTIFFVPETKGKSLLEIELILAR